MGGCYTGFNAWYKSTIMTKIFISYRREDTQTIVGRIHDHLKPHFTEVFVDYESIGAGAEFPKVIERKLTESDIALVIIGNRWLTATDKNGQRRLDNPQDFVRIEVETALRLEGQVTTIPVLVDGAKMPSSDQLPPTLERLAYKNAREIRTGRDFQRDMQDLIQEIKKSKPHWGLILLFASLFIIVAIAGLLLVSSDNEDSRVPTHTVTPTLTLTATETDIPSPTTTATVTTLAAAGSTTQSPISISELSQVFRSVDNNLSFNYPTGWVVGFDLPYVIVASNRNALTAIASDSPLNRGQVAISLLPFSTEETDMERLASQTASRLVANGGTTGMVQTVDIGQNAVRVDLRNLPNQQEGFILVIPHTESERGFAVFFAQTLSGEITSFEALLLEIASTVR